MEQLPTFRYHPDPLATGNIEPGDSECRCCRRKRGYIYVGPVYAEDELDNAFCPWCIADGSAAEMFDAEFTDDHPLLQAGVSPAVVAEVTRRTPGFTGWQQEEWLVHCGDACAFLGDAAPELLDEAARAQLAMSSEEWAALVQNYEPGGDPAVYHFRCLVCGERRFHMDFS